MLRLPAGDASGPASSRPKQELIVVASLIDRAPNLGGLCRTCEVFGAQVRAAVTQTCPAPAAAAAGWGSRTGPGSPPAVRQPNRPGFASCCAPSAIRQAGHAGLGFERGFGQMNTTPSFPPPPLRCCSCWCCRTSGPCRTRPSRRCPSPLSAGWRWRRSRRRRSSHGWRSNGRKGGWEGLDGVLPGGGAAWGAGRGISGDGGGAEG
jgi:hypothetical protein